MPFPVYKELGKSMGSTFVSIEDKGFWTRDGVLELWLRLLSLHLEEPTDESSRVCRIRDGWLLASRGYFGGSVPIGLDEAVRDEEGRQIVVTAIRELMSALKKGPATLDRQTLNLLGFTAEFVADFPAERLVEVEKFGVESLKFGVESLMLTSFR